MYSKLPQTLKWSESGYVLTLNKCGSIFVSRGKPHKRGCVRVAKIGPDLM